MSTNNLSIVQSPVDSGEKVPVITNWNPMIGFMIYKDQNISSLFFYKIGLKVYLGTDTTGTLLASYKQRRNGYSVDVSAGKARAFFDIRDVVNTQLVDTVFDQNLDGIPFSTIHKLGANSYESGGSTVYKIFSENGNNSTAQTQIAQVHVRAFDSYATSTSSAVTEFTPSTPVSNTSFYMQSSLDLFTARAIASGGIDTDYIQGVAFQKYCLDSASKNFLSDNPNVATNDFAETTFDKPVNKVMDSDYHTIAFLNGETDFNSKAHSIMVKYYNSSGTTLSTSLLYNQVSDGGANPMTSGGEVNSNAKRLIYFGCGPGNLEGFDTATSKPSNNTGWVNYTIRALDSSANPMSQEVVFVRQDDNCKGYTTRRLAWRNSLGTYDYLNFSLKSTQTIDVEKNKYNKMIGIFNKSKYRYSNWDKGQSIRQTTATKKETLNTDYILEEQAILIEKLLMSTDVYVVQNTNKSVTQSVIVTDSSYIKKTVANDKLIQYTINIEYSNNVNTNS